MATKKSLKVLCGCECSQVLTRAFRELGHEAYSCDLNPAYGPSASNGWHWQGDVEKVMQEKGPFDLICLFPPCIYLSCVGNRWMTATNSDSQLKFPDRQKKRDDAIAFVKRIFKDAPAPCVMLENPKGVLSTQWKQPNQRVCPTMFGDTMRKTTCLWTKGLPKLNNVGLRAMPDLVRKNNGHIVNAWHENTKFLPQELATQIRSQLAPCFAQAIATQYSAHILGVDVPSMPSPKIESKQILGRPAPHKVASSSSKIDLDSQLHIVVESGGVLNIYRN